VCIPDPIELMKLQIERAIDRQQEVGDGCCMACGKKVEYELIPASSHPAAWAVCFECLSPEDQRKYREFEKQTASDKKVAHRHVSLGGAH